MSTCRSCGARVTWVRSAATGKWMILDEDPLRGGNVVVIRGADGTPKAHVYRDWEAAIEAHPCMPRYQDHHVSCPQAGDWRGRG